MRRTAAGSLVALSIAAVGVAPAQPATRAPADLCARGRAYHQRGDTARAHVLLDRCVAAGGGDAGTRALRDRLARELGAGDLGVVVVSSSMPDARVTISYLAGEPALATPVTIYLPPGQYAIEVAAPRYQRYTTTIDVSGRERRTVLANAPALTGPAGTTSVDFGDQGGPAEGVLTTASPQPRKHKTLLPDRYKDAPAAPAGAALADPMPDAAAPPPRRSRAPLWIIAGVGLLAATAAVVVIAR